MFWQRKPGVARPAEAIAILLHHPHSPAERLAHVAHRAQKKMAGCAPSKA